MALQQYNPPHPGELIRRTYIEPFEDISGNMLAKRLGVAESTFNRLLNGVSAVSPEMAVRLSRVLGRSRRVGCCYKIILISGMPVKTWTSKR